MGRPDGPVPPPHSAHRARWLLALGTVAIGAFLSIATPASSASFAATGSLTPRIYYINDSAGSVYTFTVKNTGAVSNIGAVEIRRPNTLWQVTSCPTAPTGWLKTAAANKCRYRSATTSSDDIAPGQSRTFSVKAKTVPGTMDHTGTWPIVVSNSNNFAAPSLLKFAAPTGPGLTAKLRTFQLTRAVVSGSSKTPGSACPAANKTAVAGSSTTIVVCGRNRASIALTPTVGQSSLGGTFVGTPGSFLSGSIPANSGDVVLADWNATLVTGVPGSGKTVLASIGSASNRTSSLRTFHHYVATNTLPVATNDSYHVDEDTHLTVLAADGVLDNDTDAEGNPLTAIGASDPAHGTLTLNPDGSFEYDPDANFHGTDTFTYLANDSFGNSLPATVTITVVAVNDAPVSSALSVTTFEDEALPVTLVATDVEGSPLAFSIVDGPDHGTLGAVSGSAVTYTPDANYHGSDSFTYKANDGTADSTTSTVSITVNPVNDPPVAVNDAYSTDEDTVLVVTAPGVLGNDTDVEGGSLTTIHPTDPAHGDLTLNPDGSFTYTADANFNGSDSFTYKANDTTSNSTIPGTVTITVDPVNDAPVATNVTTSTDEDTAKTITLTATDVDGDSLTFTIDSGPTDGSLGAVTGNSVEYTPDANVHGSDSFTFQASDGSLSDTATVDITVNAVNDAPVANGDAYSTDEDNALVVTAPGVLGDDTDVEGSALTATLVANPTHGDVTLNADGSFTYTPDADYHGADSFTYTTSDGSASSGTAVVDITVDPVNDAPVATNVTTSTDEDTAKTITLTATDVDGDSLTFTIDTGPTDGSLGAVTGNSVEYTPDANVHGSDSFTFQASDGSLSDTATVDITVNAVNDAPVANGDAYATDEDNALVVTAPGVLGDDTDVEGSALTATLVANPTHGDVTLNADGSFTYTPDANFHGADSFTYTASDGSASSGTAVVDITVDPVNDPPVATNVTTSTDEDTAKTITLTATDVDGDSLTFTIDSGPTDGSLGAVTGNSVEYTPDADYDGPDSFTFIADDAFGSSNTATVHLTVDPVNDAPVATADAYATDEDTLLTVPVLSGVLANDDDVEDDPLTAVLVDGPAHASSFDLAADGSFTYTPDEHYNGPDSFTYHAYDGAAASGTTTVDITVNAVNDAPVADAGISSGIEDTPQVVDLGGRDPVEFSAVTFEIVDSPAHGDLGTIAGTTCGTSCTATVEYTPDADANGADSFTYRTFDGTDYSPAATVDLTVTPVNDVPSFTAGADVEVVQDLPPHTISDWAGAISKGPADESAQALTFDVDVTAVSPADLFSTAPALSPTGTLTFATTAGKVGTATVSVVLSDDGGTDDGGDDTSDAQVFTIDVVPPNVAPVAAANTASGAEDGGAILVTLTATDADDDDLTFTASTATNGLVTVPTTPVCDVTPETCTATVTYTPNADYHGPDSFTFTVEDPDLESDEATVDVTITPVNDTPTDIALSGATVDENEPSGTVVGTLSTTDVDTADTHVYQLVSGAGSGGNGSFEIDGDTLRTATMLDFETGDEYSVRIRATDSGTGALFYEEAFTISVTDVNEAPTNVTLTPATIPENEPDVTTVGTLSSTDPDAANTHTYALVSGDGDDDNAAFTLDGAAVKTVDAFDFETDSTYLIRVESTDQDGLTFEKALTVTVTDVNEMPTDVALDSQAIDENVTAPGTVGNLSTTDPDAANTFTYTFVTGTGSTDNAAFSIAGGVLKAASALNYEVKNAYSVRIRTTDQGGLFHEESFAITVNDVNDAPVAVDEVFNNTNANTDAIGNTTFTVGVAGQPSPVKNVGGSALSNDTDEDTLPSADTLTVTFPATSANGTIVTGNADGTFVYLPNAGFTGNDTFTYTLSDGQGGTDTGQVTIEVANMVWYVDAANATAGTGRSSDPYKSLSSLQGTDLDESNEIIFVYAGTYTSGISLESSQKLWGQPHGLSIDGTPLVSAGVTNPTIGNASGDAIALANDVLIEYVDIGGPTLGVGVRGVNIPNATVGTGTSISGATLTAFALTGNASGTITVNASISSTTGNAVSVSGRTGGTVTFTGAITTSNGGVVASGNSATTLTLSGAMHLTATGTAKAFSVTGGGTVVAAGSDNTASTSTGRAVEITGTAIGAGGVKFKTVSAGTAAAGPDSGIVLDGTGSTAGLTVTGTGGAGSGGVIQKTTGDAVSLKDTDLASLTSMSIQNPAHAGVQGTGVTGFTFANSTVTGAGAALNDQTDYSLAFNVDSGTSNNLDGVVSITNNTLSNAYGGGIQVLNRDGTITDLTVTGNTVSSTTLTTTSKGSGIAFDLFGTTTTVANLSKGSISSNVLTGFPSGDGIRLQGGNSASATAPSGTYGTPSGSPGIGSNRVVINGNTVQGDATNKLNGMGILVAVAGRGQGNIDVTSNGTVATPITHVKGSGIGVGAAGSVVVDFKVSNNVINGTDNIAGSTALGIGSDKNIQADSSTLANPVMRIEVNGNTLTGSTGYGIQSLNRDSNGTTNLKLQNNTVSGPGAGFSSVDVTSGSSGNASFNTTVCAHISGNTLAVGGDDGFGNKAPGIVLDKYSTSSTTYRLGLVGLSPSPATVTQTQTYLTTQNPGSAAGAGFYAGTGGAFVMTGDNFTSCSLGF